MPMPEIDLYRASLLCNTKEMRLVQASNQPGLSRLSAEELRQKIKLVRDLRDKWRDQYSSQRRRGQQEQRSRDNDQNTRSREKSELFAAVLERFETQLARLPAEEQQEPPRSKRGRPPLNKEARAQNQEQPLDHRDERARIREQLKTHEAKLANRIMTASPVPPPVELPSAEPPAPAKQTSTGRKPPKKGPAQAKRSLLTAPVQNAAKQTQAKAAAKRTRVKVSGLDTRTRGHVSARGKRAQARRDSKG